MYVKSLFSVGILVLPLLATAAEHEMIIHEMIINDFGMRFINVPAGEFMMGTTEDQIADIVFEDARNTEDDVRDETPLHLVKITQPFFLGQTEVTQEQWYSIMKTKPGDKQFWEREDWQKLPVLGVSWIDVQKFIAALESKDKKYRYRLPTEAEWEYAARGNTTDLRPFKVEQIDEYAWYFGGSDDKPMPVARLKPNSFGLYDMFGNAWEWVNDWYTDYPKTTQIDPKGPKTGKSKIRRGGSYHCSPRLIRSAYRAADSVETNYPVLGFRLIIEPRTTIGKRPAQISHRQ